MIPQLLVSVRSAEEAQVVLRAGCAIVDVKEPDNGPLGMASLEICTQVSHVVRRWNAERTERVAVSLALGDAIDWQKKEPTQSLPLVDFVKLGTAGLSGITGLETHATDAMNFAKRGTAGLTGSIWPDCWKAGMTRAGGNSTAQQVIVAYADWVSAAAPHPQEVVERAGELGCHGVLIDTWSKMGRGLFDCLPPGELQAMSAAARRQRVWFALAGGLRAEHLPTALALKPDVIGIRGAACRGGLRQAVIDEPTLRKFREVFVTQSASGQA